MPTIANAASATVTILAGGTMNISGSQFSVSQDGGTATTYRRTRSFGPNQLDHRYTITSLDGTTEYITSGGGSRVFGTEARWNDLWASSPSPVLSAQKILLSAQKGISPIGLVMGTPPTISSAGTSSLNGSATLVQGGSTYRFDNPNHVTQIGGAQIDSANGAVRGTSRVTGGVRTRAAAGSGARWKSMAPAIDLAMNLNNTTWIMQVTDFSTGVKARISALDQTSSGSAFTKLDWAGVVAPRGYELSIKFDSLNLLGLNSTAGYPITPWPVDYPTIAILGDSYDEGTVIEAGVAAPIKMGVTNWFLERLGIPNLAFNGAVGGTGLAATNGGTNTTYFTRLMNGDFDASRIGPVDLFALWLSVNDNSLLTDSAFQGLVTQAITLIRAVQPSAIILVAGPENSPFLGSTQSRWDASKAGFLAANDPNSIYLDPSPTGEDWYSPNAQSWYISTDNVHPKVKGAQYLGYRRADSFISALKAKYSL